MTERNHFTEQLQALLPGVELRFAEPLTKHTSFRIGGPAEAMAFPKNQQELTQCLEAAGKLGITPRILGAGTNILAPDDGVPGLILCLKENFDGMERLDDTHIRVMSGVTMTRAAVFAANLGLSGLEFAHGIPGTVGGGVYMNAGAYGGEICQVCSRVALMDPDGTMRILPGCGMDFGYRHSCLEHDPGIVVWAEFTLTPEQPETIKEKMRELMAKRKASQPLDLPSAGSAFKRPLGGYAAALIDQAGLKGYRVGGAAVSEKHAGFAVNLGGATAQDVVNLLEQVSDKVFEHSGIRLEPEIRLWNHL